jgi:hypothetical protein
MGIWWVDHTEEYSDPTEKMVHIYGRLIADGFGIAQATGEIESGAAAAGTGLAAGLPTGGGSLVFTAGGALVMVHGTLMGSAATADLAKQATKLLRTYRLYSTAKDGQSAQNNNNSPSTPSNTKPARDPWKLTSEGASEIWFNRQFGKFYKSKSDGLWWSEDNAGHGGSKFKVFEEGSDGLYWKSDADEFGDFIVGKHKGDTGKFIPWSDLKRIK